MKTIIRLEKLSKEYGENKVLKDINLEVERGEIISVIGPSGAGKTTLLRCISMLDSLNEGKLIIDEKNTVTKDSEEKDIKKLRDKIGVVFQDFHLWSHKTVLENVIYAPINVKGDEKNQAIKKAKEILNKVGLSKRTISGSIAKVLAIATLCFCPPD